MPRLIKGICRTTPDVAPSTGLPEPSRRSILKGAISISIIAVAPNSGCSAVAALIGLIKLATLAYTVAQAVEALIELSNEGREDFNGAINWYLGEVIGESPDPNDPDGVILQIGSIAATAVDVYQVFAGGNFAGVLPELLALVTGRFAVWGEVDGSPFVFSDAFDILDA